MSDRGAQVYGLAWMGSKFSWKVECSAQDGEWSVDVWWQKSKLGRAVQSKQGRYAAGIFEGGVRERRQRQRKEQAQID